MKSNTPIFMAALFILTTRQEQLKCPCVHELTSKMWQIETIQHHSALKKKEILIRSNMVKPTDHHAE
jgi:hypothetical protein